MLKPKEPRRWPHSVCFTEEETEARDREQLAQVHDGPLEGEPHLLLHPWSPPQRSGAPHCPPLRPNFTLRPLCLGRYIKNRREITADVQGREERQEANTGAK